MYCFTGISQLIGHLNERTKIFNQVEKKNSFDSSYCSYTMMSFTVFAVFNCSSKHPDNHNTRISKDVKQFILYRKTKMQRQDLCLSSTMYRLLIDSFLCLLLYPFPSTCIYTITKAIRRDILGIHYHLIIF